MAAQFLEYSTANVPVKLLSERSMIFKCGKRKLRFRILSQEGKKSLICSKIETLAWYNWLMILRKGGGIGNDPVQLVRGEIQDMQISPRKENEGLLSSQV
ncbi:conserved hypothetical protein [Ricinus communis]|uniref:Uncharacterized protein n=1 Tax=Ricinus communis TaxID=3988 RepID=B9RNT8_RICCO|nr:conserved hypothetical protein [Ricinus communis]